MEATAWSDADDISGSLLDVFRESGDGDSGAESKETESNCEDRDYQSIKMALLNITREVPGAETSVEKPKDKKQSRIPVRQKKHTSISSETSDMFIDTRDTDGSESELYPVDESTIGEIDISRFVCDSTSSTGPRVLTTATEADGSQPESDKFGLDCETSIRDDIGALSVDLKGMEIDMCDESACDVNETIIEAPEEFRTDATELGSGAIVLQTDVGESGCSNKEPLIRDDDNGSKAEAGDTCRRAPAEDATKPSDNESAEPDRLQCESERVGDSNSHDDVLDNNAGVEHKSNGEVTSQQQHVGTCQPAAPAVHAIAGDVYTGAGQSPPDSFIQAANEALEHGADLISKLQMLSEPVGERFVSEFDASVRSVREPAAAEPSIDAGVEVCARTSGCSRVSTATVCAALDNEGRSNPVSCDQDNHQDLRIKPQNCAKLECDKSKEDVSVVKNKNGKSAVSFERPLSWEFRNGRLVFDVAKENESNSGLEQVGCAADPRETKSDDESQSSNEEEVNSILHSRDLNKRKTETGSRLKYLERKLKEAGITDQKTEESSSSKLSNIKDVPQLSDNAKQTSACDKEEQVVDKSSLTSSDDDSTYYDANQTLPCENDELNEKTNDNDYTTSSSSFCEFDVRQVASFAGFEADDYYVVYDELDETSSDEETEYHQLRVTKPSAMRGEDLERSKHNPDQDNLKSLLKKPGRSRDSKKSNRVVFNENKNEFFDADYIILIREECDYDEDDDDGVCCCNQHEMVRLACCEPNCNCNSYEGYADPTPQSPKFAPPLEFVDAVTLSPPEGYKDMELGEQQLYALQQLSRRGQRAAVCRECSASHDEDGE